MMSMKVYIVPRWSGNAHSDWYDWLGEQIQSKHGLDCTVLAMPNWDHPKVEEATEFLHQNVGQPDASTILIGHSVGCQAILRFLEAAIATDASTKVGGLLLVAGWFEVDEVWDDVLPWIENESLNYPALRQAIGYTKVILSDNDPFTSDYARNAELWKTRLDATVHTIPPKSAFQYHYCPRNLAGTTAHAGNLKNSGSCLMATTASIGYVLGLCLTDPTAQNFAR